MSKRVLWVDNDPAYIRIYVDELIDNSYEVTVVKSVAEAESLVATNSYDLLILDVMIPTVDDKEELDYPPEQTDYGHKTGLLFYKRMKARLEENNTPVLVMTVRLDRDINDEFVQAGLPRERISTKFALRDVGDFMNMVESICK